MYLMQIYTNTTDGRQKGQIKVVGKKSQPCESSFHRLFQRIISI